MDSGQPKVPIGKLRQSWLIAIAKITLHNQSHWWVIPASLLLFGVVTAVQLAPYQTQSSGYGDGSLIFFGNANLRYYIINPIYLFIASNIAGHQRYDDLVLYRLGSRTRLWLGKASVFLALTIAYWAAVILSIEVASLPFASNITPDWSQKLLAYYGVESFAQNSSQATVWGSTVWFVLLSWLGLGGIAFVIGQITRRTGFGFIVAIALNLSGLFTQMLNPAPDWLLVLGLQRPMLFFWGGEPMLTFWAATKYWGVWYFVLAAVAIWWLSRTTKLYAFLRSWLLGTWFIMRISLGRLWIIVAIFSLVSAWIEIRMPIGSDLDALNLVNVPLTPIVGLAGPPLDAPLFSLIFLRWLLIFSLFLLLIGETAVAVLWRQHVSLLPRMGSRLCWWLSNVTAVAGLSWLYLVIFVLGNWLMGRISIEADGLLFYGQIFILYWLTLTFLGCAQLLLLLLTHSRSQTLLIIVLFLLACWLLGATYPNLLPWLPVAQTAVLAQLLPNGFVNFNGSLLVINSVLLASFLIGFIAFHRYQFASFFKHQ